MADELKPCRKCGSANHKIDQFSVNQNRFVRECRDCDYVTATYETQAEANAAWNTRKLAWWLLELRWEDVVKGEPHA